MIKTLLAMLAHQTAGFAREELILAAAVGGTLSTFGVVGAVNMGWVGGTGATGAQIADSLKAVESANLKFYQRYGAWPDEVSDGSPTGNVAVLADSRADAHGTLRGRGFHPLIPADIDSTENGLVVRYRDAGGAAIGQVVMPEGSTYRYMISLNGLTLEQARKLDEKIDGNFEPDQGRVHINYSANGKEAAIQYYVNPRDKNLAAAEQQ